VFDLYLHTKAHLSENPIIPAADVQINYQVVAGNPNYTGHGPDVQPFVMDVSFPMGNPVIKANLHPEYRPGYGDNQGAAAAAAGPSADPSTGQGVSYSGTRFYGNVDMAMFGGPPVASQMLLGYQNGKSYFLFRGDIPLGPSGISMAPLPFSLYRLSGGLGYNFPVDSFYTMSLENAQPDMKGGMLFMAGMRMGSTDGGFAFTLDGITTIKTSGEASMKFDAWLLTSDHSGNGQFQGFLQYGNGNFDGKIWGGLSLLGGLIDFNLGNSAQNAALDLHFGGGNWHLWAGKREGPRVRAKVLFGITDSYLMLGNETGLAVGGRHELNFSVGDGSVASAYVRGWMDVGVQIAPGPSVSGHFGAGAEAGVCALGACVDGSITADVTISAPPLKAKARAELDLPWPLPSVSFTVSL
jgi:hypothetical protein